MRRRSTASKRAAGAAASGSCARVTRAVRSVPSTYASSTSASARGSGTPAACSRAIAVASASRTVDAVESSRVVIGSLQLLLLLLGGEHVDDGVEIAVEHAIELVERQVHAVIGHAALAEVVR